MGNDDEYSWLDMETIRDVPNVASTYYQRLPDILELAYGRMGMGGDIRYVRYVVSIGRLIRKLDRPQQVELIMITLMKYGAGAEGK